MKLSLAHPFHSLQPKRMPMKNSYDAKTSDAAFFEPKPATRKREHRSFYFLTAIVVLYAVWAAAMITSPPAVTGVDMPSIPGP